MPQAQPSSAVPGYNVGEGFHFGSMCTRYHGIIIVVFIIVSVWHTSIDSNMTR